MLLPVLLVLAFSSKATADAPPCSNLLNASIKKLGFGKSWDRYNSERVNKKINADGVYEYSSRRDKITFGNGQLIEQMKPAPFASIDQTITYGQDCVVKSVKQTTIGAGSPVSGLADEESCNKLRNEKFSILKFDSMSRQLCTQYFPPNKARSATSTPPTSPDSDGVRDGHPPVPH